MWQAGILILYLIHHAHTANDPRCPAVNRSVICNSYLIIDRCQTDNNCHGGKVCCQQKCGKKCVIPIKPKPKLGICPPVVDKPASFCMLAKVASSCSGNDADCKGSKKCCPSFCGCQKCLEPISDPRPGCPAVPELEPQCFHFNQQCSHDIECSKGQLCCFNPSCGTSCRDKEEPVTKPGECPPNTPGVICPLFVRPGDCVDDGSCPGKQKCCLQGCSRNCVDPEPRCGPVCAISCPFGNVLDENNCPTCRCKTGCKGNVNPLESISCGAGQQRCPARYQCNTPSAGGSGVCCPYECPLVKCSEPCPYGCVVDVNGCQTCECKPRCGPVCAISCPFGNVLDENNCPTCRCKTGCKGNVNPLESISCGAGQQRCPARYQCNTPSAGGSGVCCPYECPLVKCSEPCPYGCVVDVNGCQTCECKPRCGPVCAISCPFGNVLDENNCPTCRCKTGCKGNVYPLESISCGSGQQRCPARYQCNTPPAGGGSGVCCPYECPPVKCSEPCPYGHVIDVNGCLTCECKPRCGPVCAIFCPFGNVLDENNCPTCRCKTGCKGNVNPLESISCGAGQQRCPARYQCNTPSVGGSGVCCPYECPPVQCSEPCPYGHVIDVNGCQTCECKPRCGPVCAISCPFGNVLDENNCPICRCKTGCKDNVNPLESISCGSGQQRCPARYQCNTPPAGGGSGVCCPYECPLVRCSEPCPYGYVIDVNGCQTCECKPRCGPVCAISCPFGNVLDENNCPTCRCKTGCKGNVNPLGSISCGSGQQRCPARFQCNTPPAGGSGVCCPYECPPVRCSEPCLYGYVIDVNGCQTCECKPRCGPVCAISCPFGNVLDENNCPTCRCKTGCKDNVYPLESISCGSGQQRCPPRYQCNTPPVGGSGVCCPYECPLVRCSEPCPYGYVIDVNGCQTCECKPRCPSVCLVFCPFGNIYDENNCPTCACKTGCAGNVKPLPSINCGSGQQRCPARYQCNTPPTDGDGVCCPYVCPQIKCSRQCPYGYKYDVNGCQTCQCLPACEKGTPQGTCRIGPFPSTPCPLGTYCKNSVCCKIPCKFGDPHPTLSCGMVSDSNKCPAGYSCLGGPADEYFACCPDENMPTTDKCRRDRYPKSKCYVRRSCRSDLSCRGKKKCCKQGCQYKCVNPVY
ncbi:unnamed protein product [Mytilus coruscus]|uniref:Uncharacterized protein n=1 Tax=Mytilus coruscus TaxID=42192 RepID=A0A6J8CQJ6_MYTCO|nr:unnamed protein product [Mytilus coruscus]